MWSVHVLPQVAAYKASSWFFFSGLMALAGGTLLAENLHHLKSQHSHKLSFVQSMVGRGLSGKGVVVLVVAVVAAVMVVAVTRW